MTKAEIHDLVDRIIGGYNAHDVRAVLATLAEDITWTEPEGTWHGKEEVGAAVQATFDGFPDSAWPMDQVMVMVNDDHTRLAVTWRWQGTHTSTYNGLPPTGRSIDVHGMTLAFLRDGVISELTFFMDTYDYLEQLGLVPSTEGLGFKVLTTAEFTLGKVREVLHV
jgi:steroid delta-isomerase-like uncharacterized protein